MTVTKFELRPMIYEISLPQSKVWSAGGDLRGEKITCTAGRLWITQENDLKDYILTQGEVFWVTRSGTVVVEAIQDGQFIFSRLDGYKQPERN